MRDNLDLEEIKKLFLNQQYENVIKLSGQSYRDIDAPLWLVNIIGISKILQKNKKDDDFLLALSLFKRVFIKGGKNLIGLEGLSNLIATSLILLNNKNLSEECQNYLKKCEEYYLSSEKIFRNNLKFINIGSNLFYYLLDINKEKEILRKLINSDLKIKDTIISKYLFVQNYTYSWSQNNHYDAAKKYSYLYSNLSSVNLNKIDFSKNKKIKIGFVSSDLQNNHSISYFVASILKFYNKDTVELYAYSFANNDDFYLKKKFIKWHNLKNITNQETVKKIQSDKIQILIDMMGHTSGKRIQLFNTRISPVQISWLAYCNTLGFKNVDYLLADNNLIFKNEEKFYTEKILRLPKIWNTHVGFELDRQMIETPCIKNKEIHYCSFNNFKKISEETVEVWSKILKLQNNSKLILKSSHNVYTNKLLNKFKKYGVDGQVKILDRSNYNDINDHLNLYDDIDIALDTFPYNGVTTTFEALWKGIPVVTMSGYNFNSRCGESILKSANLRNLISLNKKDYVDKVLFYSKNLLKLIDLRKKIFNTVLISPLFDAEVFSKDFYNLIIDTYKKIK